MVRREALPMPRASLAILFSGAFVVYLYSFLHEAGHAVAALACGGRLLGFDIGFLTLGAHVRVAGRFSPAQDALLSLAGVALPYLLWAGFMLAAPRRADPLLETLKAVSAAGVLSTLLPWILLSLAYRAGYALPGDDATQLLAGSRLDPLLVAAAFAGAVAAGGALFLGRTGGLRDELALVLGGEEPRTGTSRRTPAAMAVTWAAAAILVGAINLALRV